MGSPDNLQGRVVATKLAPSRQFGDLIARTHLHEKLCRARDGKLTLITAPAGFGKSVLASMWRKRLIADGCDVAWLQLADEDDEKHQFVAAIVASLRNCGCAALHDFDADADSFVPQIVNGVAAHGRELFLMLDGFHCIGDPAILDAMRRLIDLAPANLHFVLIARSTPPIALSKFRLGGELTEIDSRDLRFSLVETTEFLTQRVGPDLDSDDIRLCFDLSDGWPAGLQLLAINLRGAPDKKQRLRDVLRHSQHFADFMAEDVLAHLDAVLQDFLAAISICRRFCPDLCSAITGREEAAEMLDRLGKQHLLLQPDTERGGDWWLLPPILHRFLKMRAAELPAERLAALHRSAAAWHAAHGYPVEAVRHYLKGNDSVAAVTLAESHIWQLFLDENLLMILSWGGHLTEETIAASPRTMVALAWTRLLCRQVEAGAALLDQIERSPFMADPWIKLTVNCMRGLEMIQRDDSAGLLRSLTEAGDLSRIADPSLCAALCNHASFGNLQIDNYQGALDFCRLGVSLRDERDLIVVGYNEICIGWINDVQGNLHEAERRYEWVVKTIEAQRGRRSGVASLAACLLGVILYEQNRLDELRALVANRLDVIGIVGIPDSLLRSAIMRARLLAALDGPAAGLPPLDDLDRMAIKEGLPRLSGWAMAEKIRLLILDWKLAAAQQVKAELDRLAARHRPETICTLSELPLAHDLSQARLLLATGKYAEAIALLDQVLAVWQGRGRKIVACQLRILLAVAHAKTGERGKALDVLRPAAELAMAQGMVRSFLDEGPSVLELLADLPTGSPLIAFAERLRAASGVAVRPAAAPAAREAGPQLSAREADILRLMGQAMTNKRIAIALEISGETVKWHLKNIFGKLEVFTRADAIAKARRLGLIS